MAVRYGFKGTVTEVYVAPEGKFAAGSESVSFFSTAGDSFKIRSRKFSFKPMETPSGQLEPRYFDFEFLVSIKTQGFGLETRVDIELIDVVSAKEIRPFDEGRNGAAPPQQKQQQPA